MISARGVQKRYGGAGGLLALEDVTLDIAEGEFVSLLGPSGCGKSTFLRCLAGLERPTGGALLLDEAPVNGPPEKLGIAFQRDALLDWFSVLENTLLPADFGGFGRFLDCFLGGLAFLGQGLFGVAGGAVQGIGAAS